MGNSNSVCPNPIYIENDITYIESGTEVRNKSKTSGEKSVNNENWLPEYRKKTNQPKKTLDCSKMRCTEEGTHGGHVIVRVDDKNMTYIIPLCPSHNNYTNTEPFQVVKVRTYRPIKKKSK